MSDDRTNIPNAPQERVSDRPEGYRNPSRGENVMAREPAQGTAPGATTPAASDGVVMPAMGTGVAPTTGMVTVGDWVRWGPVWAGLLTALGLFLILEFLAYGIGILTADTNGSITLSGAAPWITGVLELVAFFVGSYITGLTSAVRGINAGWINGLVVWALGIALTLLLSTAGLGALFSVLGTAVGQSVSTGANANQFAQMTQNTALGVFLLLVLSVIVAVLGGILGSITRLPGRLASRRPTQS